MATAIDLRLICMNFTLFEPAIVALKKPSTVCFPGFSAFSEMFGRIRHMMDVFKVVQQKYPTKKLTPKNQKTSSRYTMQRLHHVLQESRVTGRHGEAVG